MDRAARQPFIHTIKERCRVCYTCVRECPARAIRITAGQAEVVPGACIGCGNCVRVCRQNAKQYVSSINEVFSLLETNENVVACIAPSFPADFSNIGLGSFIGMVRKLGFKHVHEVAFGADIIAKKTFELLAECPEKRYISSACPSVNEYVKCYHPDLVPYIEPMVSPMVATGRILRKIYGENIKTIFIGPCLAKKFEAKDPDDESVIDEVLTFSELRLMFVMKDITPESVTESDFEPPFASKGALFPLSRGMHQSAGIYEDLIRGDIVAADGRTNFIEAIKEFELGVLDARFLELLCCNGCIMGAGMSTDDPAFKRRANISKYVRRATQLRNPKDWKDDIKKFYDLDYSREFKPTDQRKPLPNEKDIVKVLISLGKEKHDDELNCGACGYDTCREHAISIINGLAETEMCLPYSIERLHFAVKQLAETNKQLASTKEALRQSEKLASMGQLAAGIAHELNNPLGIVLMYSHLLLDEIDNTSRMHDDVDIITQEADRCKKIVSGLLNFARQNKVTLHRTNICEMIDQCLNIANIPPEIEIKIEHFVSNPFAEIDRDQILQVMNNLISNAITAMEKDGKLTIQTKGDSEKINISISDSGCGIAEPNLKKIFEPFFTTKQIGKGTGLGLAVSYGIIKMHKGQISVVSNADVKKGQTGTTFTVTLPRKLELPEPEPIAMGFA